MTSAENAGWIIAAGLILNIALFVVGHYFGKRAGRGDCQSCGIEGLRAEQSALKKEVKELCMLVIFLAEKAGLNFKERKEIAALAEVGGDST